MYYPQDTPKEKGPTAVLPGSHFMPTASIVDTEWDGGRLMATPAGTIFMTHYSIMHRKSRSNWKGTPTTRNMLKYCYWRRTPPHKDWADEPGFDLRTANFGTHRLAAWGTARHVRAEASFAAEMYLWLCGRPMPRTLGGQAWPGGGRYLGNAIDSSYGFPPELEAAVAAEPREQAWRPGAPGLAPDNVFWSRQPGGEDEVAGLRAEVTDDGDGALADRHHSSAASASHSCAHRVIGGCTAI
jgi:hypothetical protein